MNEKQAREFAAAHGIAVSKTSKTVFGPLGMERAHKVITVGSMTVVHDGFGGAGCWKVNRTGPGVKCGEAIKRAVLAQITK